MSCKCNICTAKKLNLLNSKFVYFKEGTPEYEILKENPEMEIWEIEFKIKKGVP